MGRITMLETVFLGVLVLALLLGNAFLSITSPKRARRMPEGEMPELDALAGRAFPQQAVSGQSAFESHALAQPPVLEQSFPAFETKSSFEEDVESERIDYLNRRMARLEQLLLKINGSKPLAEKINGSTLSQKLGDLDEFRQNTRLEIAALKQRLDKVQPVERKAKGNVPEISDEKLRDLVFRASH